jgi:hypothetical protein
VSAFVNVILRFLSIQTTSIDSRPSFYSIVLYCLLLHSLHRQDTLNAMIALKIPETDSDLDNGEGANGKQSSAEHGVSEEKGEKVESSTKSPSSSAVKSAKKGAEEKAEVKNGKEEEKEVEEEEEEEEEEKVVLRLDKTLTWFQPPVPQNRTSYTPVHLGPLLTAASDSATSSAATSAIPTSSSSSAEEQYDSAAVREILGGSIDAVRNEVLEVLTRTIYSVARSMRPDPVSALLCCIVSAAHSCVLPCYFKAHFSLINCSFSVTFLIFQQFS